MNTKKSYVRAEKVSLHSEIKKICKQMANIKELAYSGDENSQLEWSKLWHKRDSSYRRIRELDAWLLRHKDTPRKGEKDGTA